MNRYGFAVIACALGVGACSHLREPSDDQLVALLHDARISPAEANARLDAGAIRCLRVWSGDDKLLLNLPPGAADEDGRKTCHGRIDALLADKPEWLVAERESYQNVLREERRLKAARADQASER